MLSAFQRQDGVVSILGAGGFLEQKKVADAATKAGVKKFLSAEFSTNTLNGVAQGLGPGFQGRDEKTARA